MNCSRRVGGASPAGDMVLVVTVAAVAYAAGRWLMLAERVAGWIEANAAGQRDELIWVPVAINIGFLAVAIRRWRRSSTGMRAAAARAGELERDVRRDTLTGLANRAALHEFLELATARSRRRGGRTSVIFIDLVMFKAVNDRLGHLAGDRVLVEAGRRMQAASRAEDLVARFGGDEFVIVCEDDGTGSARVLADRLSRSLHEPYVVRGESLVVPASIGVVLAPRDANAGDVLREADMAMYQAKSSRSAAPQFVDLAG